MIVKKKITISKIKKTLQKIRISSIVAIGFFGILLVFIQIIFYNSLVKAISSQTIGLRTGIINQNQDPLPDGNYNFKFILFNTPFGGSALWSETHNNVLASNGFISVSLGTYNSFNPVIFEQNQDLYIQICLDANGIPGDGVGVCGGSFEEMFLPRRKINASTFSFRSRDLGPATIVNAGDTAYNINTYGNNGDIFKFRFNNTDILTLSTNGILILNDGTNNIQISAPNKTISLPLLSKISIGNSQNILSYPNYLALQTNNLDRIIITNTGNVGIGTTSPGGKLEVSGGKSVFSQSTNQYASIQIQQGTNPTSPVSGDLWWNGTNLFFFNGTNSIDLLGNNCSVCFVNGGNNFGSNAILGLNSNHDLSIHTNSTERLRIFDNGSIVHGNSSSTVFNKNTNFFGIISDGPYARSGGNYTNIRSHLEYNPLSNTGVELVRNARFALSLSNGDGSQIGGATGIHTIVDNYSNVNVLFLSQGLYSNYGNVSTIGGGYLAVNTNHGIMNVFYGINSSNENMPTGTINNYVGITTELINNGTVTNTIIAYEGIINQNNVVNGQVVGIHLDVTGTGTISNDSYGIRILGLGNATGNKYNFWAQEGLMRIAPSTSNHASLRIPVGTNPTSPVSGDLWWNGTSLFFFNGLSSINLLQPCTTCFVAGGNAFGYAPLLGTTDNFDLIIIRNNISRINLQHTGTQISANFGGSAIEPWLVNLDLQSHVTGTANVTNYFGFNNQIETLLNSYTNNLYGARHKIDIKDNSIVDNFVGNQLEVSYLDNSIINNNVYLNSTIVTYSSTNPVGGNVYGHWLDINTIQSNDIFGIYIENLGNPTGNKYNFWAQEGLMRIAPSTSNHASLRIPVGTNPTSPVSGDLWWNGTNLFFFNGTNSIDLLVSGGNPAGSNGQIQFNNNGSFGASSQLYWDNSLNLLGIGTNLPDAKLTIDTSTIVSSQVLGINLSNTLSGVGSGVVSTQAGIRINTASNNNGFISDLLGTDITVISNSSQHGTQRGSSIYVSNTNSTFTNTLSGISLDLISNNSSITSARASNTYVNIQSSNVTVLEGAVVDMHINSSNISGAARGMLVDTKATSSNLSNLSGISNLLNLYSNTANYLLGIQNNLTNYGIVNNAITGIDNTIYTFGNAPIVYGILTEFNGVNNTVNTIYGNIISFAVPQQANLDAYGIYISNVNAA
ncbi:MAG: hypothetical protein NZZ41_05970, partial [Candidatus Dojkabacteria bacterium]|nr:hypothetical protein [Candidatus Dojkabacteria bacterium]